MDGSEFHAIRRQLGRTKVQFAQLLGYTGSEKNMITQIDKYEQDRRQVPLYIARLAWLLGQLHANHPIPADAYGMPRFPDWPGYVYDHEPDPGQKENIDG